MIFFCRRACPPFYEKSYPHQGNRIKFKQTRRKSFKVNEVESILGEVMLKKTSSCYIQGFNHLQTKFE